MIESMFDAQRYLDTVADQIRKVRETQWQAIETAGQWIAEALTALLVVPGSPVQRVDVLPAGDDFRVVAWPYPGRDEALRAQAALQARGHRLQVISF